MTNNENTEEKLRSNDIQALVWIELVNAEKYDDFITWLFDNFYIKEKEKSYIDICNGCQEKKEIYGNTLCKDCYHPTKIII